MRISVNQILTVPSFPYRYGYIIIRFMYKVNTFLEIFLLFKKALAQEKGIQQKTIAEACGVSAATISGWIKLNVDTIPSSCIVPLARLFECSPMEILTGEKYATNDRDTDTQRLLDMYADLDWEGKQIVAATIIEEKRRLDGSLARARV